MKAVGWLFSPLLKATGILKSPKKKTQAQPAPLPTATRDDAEAAAAQRDELLRRRGGAADIVTGTYGAEGGGGGKTTLGA